MLGIGDALDGHVEGWDEGSEDGEEDGAGGRVPELELWQSSDERAEFLVLA